MSDIYNSLVGVGRVAPKALESLATDDYNKAVENIYDLYKDIGRPQLPADYVEKMLHKVPAAPVYDRKEYLLRFASGKVVLDIGASGPMSTLLQKAAKEYHSIGINENHDLDNYHMLNLEHDPWPMIDGLDIVIAGEIIEHLSNAGLFLENLRNYEKQVILTTPNAFGAVGANYIKRGIESVNKEHVSWYSYHTLSVLVKRHGFNVLSWGWYNGQPLIAEGIIFNMEPVLPDRD